MATTRADVAWGTRLVAPWGRGTGERCELVSLAVYAPEMSLPGSHGWRPSYGPLSEGPMPLSKSTRLLAYTKRQDLRL